jgi:hypothetical protein
VRTRGDAILASGLIAIEKRWDLISTSKSFANEFPFTRSCIGDEAMKKKNTGA